MPQGIRAGTSIRGIAEEKKKRNFKAIDVALARKEKSMSVLPPGYSDSANLMEGLPLGSCLKIFLAYVPSQIFLSMYFYLVKRVLVF